MFDYFIGQIKDKTPAHLVLEVNGIAFKMLIPLSTYERLPTTGEIKIFAYLGIQSGLQENVIRLFGFATLEERKLFHLLITVDRIGPMLALRMLSSSSVAQIKQAVVSEDTKLLERMRGVGAKTAQRIVLELKETLQRWVLSSSSSSGSSKSAVDLHTDAILALISLGYQRTMAEKAVKAILQRRPKIDTIEEIVKLVLQQA